jgi:hypothetical protein
MSRYSRDQKHLLRHVKLALEGVMPWLGLHCAPVLPLAAYSKKVHWSYLVPEATSALLVDFEWTLGI